MTHCALAVLLAGLCAGSSFAQSVDLAAGAPKVLYLQSEMLKPGQSGGVHERSEGAFIRAQQAAGSSVFYLGMTSLSGPSRALFEAGHPTMAAFERENAAVLAKGSLSTALDQAMLADGELLTEYTAGLYTLRGDLSLPDPDTRLKAMRFFEVDRFKIKPGHVAKFEKIAASYKDSFQKAVPGTEFVGLREPVWAESWRRVPGGASVYRPGRGGQNSGGFSEDGRVRGCGDDGAVEQPVASAVESSEANLFQVAPSMSFVPASWGGMDPFWKLKTPPAVHAKKAAQ